MNLDPNDPDFPLKPDHVLIIKSVMLLKNESLLRKALVSIANDDVPLPLLAVVCCFVYAMLPPAIANYWEPLMLVWKQAIPENMKEPLEQFLTQVTKEEKDTIDEYMTTMMKASWTPGKADFYRSRASVN